MTKRRTAKGLHPAIKSVSFTPAVTPAGEKLAERTEDAYSFERYGEGEWKKAATMLLQKGYSEREAEAILRSKWPRWAGDTYSDRYETTAEHLRMFVESHAGKPNYSVAELVAGTF